MISQTPNHRTRIGLMSSGRLSGPNEWIGSVYDRERPCFNTTDGRERAEMSRAVMLVWMNERARDRQSASIIRYRPSMHVRGARARARDLWSMRALRTDSRARAHFPLPGQGKGLNRSCITFSACSESQVQRKKYNSFGFVCEV